MDIQLDYVFSDFVEDENTILQNVYNQFCEVLPGAYIALYGEKKFAHPSFPELTTDVVSSLKVSTQKEKKIVSLKDASGQL
ncbi:MAG: hypothetical protein KAQ71_20735, partial [Desulfobulbaceae bacterium]|nr:hypothetical protein [Desulfobulbaceae bacterium]